MSYKNRFLIPLCVTAIFSALGIVLEAYLKIPFSFLEISLAFAPMLICGMFNGPYWGAACAFIVDLIATMIAGRGMYFLGFAPVVLLTGYIFGLIGQANRSFKSGKSFCLITAALVLVNGTLCEGVFKTFMICVYQVYVVRSQPEITWTLFFGWFGIRMAYAAIQGVAIFILALVARGQIIPKLDKVVRRVNG